jgi:hypothetical protein
VREHDLRISIAGNTAGPALFALKAKGYAIALSYRRQDDPDGSVGYTAEYAAEKDRRVFCANSPEELLGLVAMWEVRGDDWRRRTDSERAWHDALVEAARVYDRDGEEVDE